MSLSVLDRCDRSVQSQQIPLGFQDVFFVVVLGGSLVSDKIWEWCVCKIAEMWDKHTGVLQASLIHTIIVMGP